MLTILNLTILIPWTEIEPSRSVFVPCLDRAYHERVLLWEAEKQGYKVVCKHVVENGKYGLRLWRIE